MPYLQRLNSYASIWMLRQIEGLAVRGLRKNASKPVMCAILSLSVSLLAPIACQAQDATYQVGPGNDAVDVSERDFRVCTTGGTEVFSVPAVTQEEWDAFVAAVNDRYSSTVALCTPIAMCAGDCTNPVQDTACCVCPENLPPPPACTSPIGICTDQCGLCAGGLCPQKFF
jgi:hypothetical protein